MSIEDTTGARRLALTVHIPGPDGELATYPAGTVPPPAVARAITNPAAWAAEPAADPVGGGW